MGGEGRVRRAAFYSTVNFTGRLDIGDVIINLIKSRDWGSVRFIAGPNAPGESPRKSSRFRAIPRNSPVPLEEISKCNRAFYRFSIIKTVQSAWPRAGDAPRNRHENPGK